MAYKKSITILGRKTDILLLIAACMMTMIITINTMCDCKTCKMTESNSVEAPVQEINKDTVKVSTNTLVDELPGVSNTIFEDYFSNIE